VNKLLMEEARRHSSTTKDAPKGEAERKDDVAEEGQRTEADTTSAMDTRMPETQEAELAQKLEETLEAFPSRDTETGQIPPLGVSCFLYFRFFEIADFEGQVANDETIIIHPGSRYLKIGRGSDLT
jgi:hypothetical protein